MVQSIDPKTGACSRVGRSNLLEVSDASEVGYGEVRLTSPQAARELKPGMQLQFRNVTRDVVSGFNNRSRDIAFEGCEFHALPGMGIVSQFCENIAFSHTSVVPPAGTLRTCPAWADCFHFSGCRGSLLIDGCRFYGTQDDPINVHGTHLRIVRRVDDHTVLARFMHPQTLGFAAFQAGDSVSFVSHKSLLPYGERRVTGVKRISDTDWEVSFDAPSPAFDAADVLDNISWYPDVTVRNCVFDGDSCRGILVTSRGKVRIEGNEFRNTAMSAILIADDANSWFESGQVKDVVIRNNRFERCGSPVIDIHPEAAEADPTRCVHSNILIFGNQFRTGEPCISAFSVDGLTIRDNDFSRARSAWKSGACRNFSYTSNRMPHP